jgi:5'-nucleotidase
VPDAVAPFKFGDISDAVNQQVKVLHRLGVHTIVVLAHAGGFMTPAPPSGEIISETAQMDPDVDLVVAGHTHSLLNTRVNNTLIVQAFRYGTAFDKVTLTVDRRTKDVTTSAADVITTYHQPPAPLPPAPAPQQDLTQLVQEFRDRIAPVASRVVGHAATAIATTTTAAGESPIGDLIADAQAHETGAQIALMNPGGIRAAIDPGEVTFSDLFAVQPFDNGMVRMTLTGAQLKAILEQQFNDSAPNSDKILQVSGLKETYDRSRAAGDRVTSITLADGTPIDPAASYTVAENSFLATGGDGFTVFKQGTNVQSFGSDVDALDHYVQSLPQPFSAPDPNASPRIVKAG